MSPASLPALQPGMTRALYVRRWPMRVGSPNAVVANINVSVAAVDIGPDGSVVKLPFSWAGPGSPERLDRIFDDAEAIGATGIVPNLGSGKAGAFIPLDRLARNRRALLDAVPMRPFSVGSLPLAAPKGWRGP